MSLIMMTEAKFSDKSDDDFDGSWVKIARESRTVVEVRLKVKKCIPQVPPYTLKPGCSVPLSGTGVLFTVHDGRHAKEHC